MALKSVTVIPLPIAHGHSTHDEPDGDEPSGEGDDETGLKDSFDELWDAFHGDDKEAAYAAFRGFVEQVCHQAERDYAKDGE